MRHSLTKKLDKAADNVLKAFESQYDLHYYGEFDPLQHVLLETLLAEEDELTYIEVTIFDLCNALDRRTPVEDVYRWLLQCEMKYISLHNYLMK